VRKQVQRSDPPYGTSVHLPALHDHLPMSPTHIPSPPRPKFVIDAEVSRSVKARYGYTLGSSRAVGCWAVSGRSGNAGRCGSTTKGMRRVVRFALGEDFQSRLTCDGQAPVKEERDGGGGERYHLLDTATHSEGQNGVGSVHVQRLYLGDACRY
jgi:hypothetical protein